jgi:hypothetical protein
MSSVVVATFSRITTPASTPVTCTGDPPEVILAGGIADEWMAALVIQLAGIELRATCGTMI